MTTLTELLQGININKMNISFNKSTQMKQNNKVVLAFSGGLDTTYCALYLQKTKNLEVHAAIVNTGGFSKEELAKIEAHALNLGVKSFKVLDETNNYYQTIIKYLVFG